MAYADDCYGCRMAGAAVVEAPALVAPVGERGGSPVALGWGVAAPVRGCGGRCRRPEECSGYTWLVTFLSKFQCPGAHQGAGHAGHFGGTHGFFQLADSLPAKIWPQSME